jgi:hypothetical protein
MQNGDGGITIFRNSRFGNLQLKIAGMNAMPLQDIENFFGKARFAQLAR